MVPGLAAYMLAAARPKGAPATPVGQELPSRDSRAAVSTAEASQSRRCRSRSPQPGPAAFAMEGRACRFTPCSSSEGLVDRLFHLFQPACGGGCTVNSLGFVLSSELAAAFDEEDLDQLVQLALAKRLPEFEILVFRSEVWIRRAGGAPLAIVSAWDIPRDGSWVRE